MPNESIPSGSNMTHQPDPNSKSTAASVWRIAFLVLCVIGILLSADLLRLHVMVHTDSDYHSFCAVNEYVDCEEVALSDYAVFARLPVALWGLLGYLFMGGLCIWGLKGNQDSETWPGGILFGLSLFSVAVSLLLFAISHAVIQSLCIVCIATYLVNLILCTLAFADLRKKRIGPFSALRKELGQIADKITAVVGYVGTFGAVIIILWLALPVYWSTEASKGPGGLPVGTTSEGIHWIGARKPVVEIVEFSDYQCPYCIRKHAEMRSLVAQNPRKIRLFHRHFPLRRHAEAFNYAVMAHCAGRQDRFWEANDYLFANGKRKKPVTPNELASALQIDAVELSACQANDASRMAIAEDVRAGRAHKVKGTPTFVIGDKVYRGGLPKGLIESLLSK